MSATVSSTEETFGQAMVESSMDSGMELSDGLKLWGDFSWITPLDSAASIAVMVSAVAVLSLQLAMLPLFARGLLHFVRARTARGLKNLLIAPVGIAVLYLGFAVGPYFLLGFWSALGIAGAGYAVARRVALWRLIRRFPEAVEASGYSSSPWKGSLKSGRRIRWMMEDLEGRSQISSLPLGVASVAKDRSLV